MFKVTARHTTNSNISNYVSTKKVFRIISLLIVMSTEKVEPTRSLHKVGSTIDKRNGRGTKDRTEQKIT